MSLPFKKEVKRADRSNLIDCYVRGTVGTDIPQQQFAASFEHEVLSRLYWFMSAYIWCSSILLKVLLGLCSRPKIFSTLYSLVLCTFFCALQPEPFTDAERKEWITKMSSVSVSSDAFFPFRDNIDRARQSGVKYVLL